MVIVRIILEISPGSEKCRRQYLFKDCHDTIMVFGCGRKPRETDTINIGTVPKTKRDRYNQYRHSMGVAYGVGPLEVIGEVNDVLIYMFMTPLGQNAKYSSFCVVRTRMRK